MTPPPELDARLRAKGWVRMQTRYVISYHKTKSSYWRILSLRVVTLSNAMVANGDVIMTDAAGNIRVVNRSDLRVVG